MSNNGAAKGPCPQGETEPPATTQRRGRGRPRKPPQEPAGPPTPKRPRGRPRGSKNKGPRAATKKAEPVGEKRPRGRPRKWPQKAVKEEGGQKERPDLFAFKRTTAFTVRCNRETIKGEPEEAREGPSQAPPPEEGE